MYRMATRHPSRLRTALEKLAVYALGTAFSFGFWYALFVAVAER